MGPAVASRTTSSVRRPARPAGAPP
jgi:hypothetical protein